MKLTPPTPEEYAPYYGAYVGPATARGDVLAALPKQIDELNAALSQLTDEQARFKFGPAEWSIKEVVGHMNDVERIFSYRLLCISRNDKTPLPGFEQNDYVREAGFDDHPLSELLAEFELLRRANILAIKNMSEAGIDQRGTASGYTFSARALIYILVGHVEHHMTSLHENYLSAMKS